MPNSSAAARNFRIGSERLGSARARSEVTGVTPIPPGGASGGAFGAKLATLALDYYNNRGKVDAATLKAQADTEYRDLQVQKLRQDLAPKQTYEVGGIGGLTGYEAVREKRLGQPPAAAPEALVPAAELAALGIPPNINTRPGANAYLVNRRAQRRNNDIARLNSESMRASRELTQIDAEEKRYADSLMAGPGNKATFEVEAQAASDDPMVRALAMKRLGLPSALAIDDVTKGGTTAGDRLRVVHARTQELRSRWEGQYREHAARRFAPQREALLRRLQGLRANMPLSEEVAPTEEDHPVESPAIKAFREALDN